MKKLLLLGLILLLTCPAMAAETSRGKYTTYSPWLTDMLNSSEDFYHNHDYVDRIGSHEEYDNPYGIGLNVKVYDFRKDFENRDSILDNINVEQKYDFNNQAYSAFVNLDIDITSLFK